MSGVQTEWYAKEVDSVVALRDEWVCHYAVENVGMGMQINDSFRVKNYIFSGLSENVRMATLHNSYRRLRRWIL